MKFDEGQRAVLTDLLNEVYSENLMDSWVGLSSFIRYHPLQKSLGLSSSDGATKNAIIVEKYRVVLKWAHNKNSNDAVREVEIYNRAVNKGLEQFFPHTELFCRVGPYRVVLQEMIDSSCSDLENAKAQRLERKSAKVNPKILTKVRDDVENACNNYRRTLDKTWAARALVIYGKRKVKALCQFIKDEGINDLHGQNIGYLNGKPVLLDFCGYYGGR